MLAGMSSCRWILWYLETAKQMVRDFQDIHEDHINISRFANHSPFVFATSSFDRTVSTKTTSTLIVYLGVYAVPPFLASYAFG